MTGLLVLFLFLVIAWNGFFVAAEYAFVAARPSALRERADAGSRRAAEVLRLQKDPTRFVAAVQVAITMSSLAAGAVGEPTLRRLLDPALEPLGELGGRILSSTLSVAIAFAVVTAFTVVLGEIIPKTFTLGRAEQVALAVIRPVQVFSRIFRPFIALLEWLSRLGTRALGLPDPEPPGSGLSEEELKQLVTASHEEGVLERDASDMIARVFDFGETEVRQVMVPRPDVVALRADTPVGEAADQIARFPHTRYPVYEDGLDGVVGILHARDLLEDARTGGGAHNLRELARPAQYVPETSTLGQVMRDLRGRRAHLAIVLDEYGSLAGVVTLEDLVEEIVGEIEDEYDIASTDMRPIGRDQWLVAGAVPLADIAERLGAELSELDATSAGGAVFSALGRLPDTGDSVELGGLRLTVQEMSGTRVEWLVLTRIGLSPDDR